MIKQRELGERRFAQLRQLHQFIQEGEIQLGGNSKLKIYGTLNCTSGKRMKIQNRVFFQNEAEAVGMGYRPCGHCLREQYKVWKERK